jgi:hypothetical protein
MHIFLHTILHILHIALHILHVVLHTAAYYLTYSAYFAYCNVHNIMQNLNIALFFCIMQKYAKYAKYAKQYHDDIILHILHIVLHTVTVVYYLTYSS